MKISEVPQQDGDVFEKEVKVIQYALDEDGKFTAVTSVGWEPKTIVMQNAWSYENEKAEAAHQLVLAGKRSTLYYHARKHMMNARLLSAYTGICSLKVLLHFRPSFFSRVSEKNLQKYANAFGYKTTEELHNIT